MEIGHKKRYSTGYIKFKNNKTLTGRDIKELTTAGK